MAKKQVRAEELRNQDFILREQGSGTRNIFENYMRTAKIPIHVVGESTSSTAIIEMVMRGLGLGVLSPAMCPAVYFRAADLLLHHPGYADEPVFLHLLFGWSSGDLSNGRLDPPLPADCAAGLALTKKEFVMKPWQHFKTITRHRLLVMVNCFGSDSSVRG